MRRLKAVFILVAMVFTGVVLANGALATGTINYSDGVDVQFTFNESLSVAVSAATISTSVAPGSTGESSDATVTVTTTNASGYVLKAYAGNSTYTSNALVNSGAGTSLAAITSTITTGSWSDNTWGYSIDSGTTYKGLPYGSGSAATLTTTSSNAGTATTSFRIKAKAASNLASGDYLNVVNFLATANVTTYTVTVANGTNVTGAKITKEGSTTVNKTTGNYVAGTVLTITASATSGHTFNHWVTSADFGTFGSATTATTTYTVGVGSVTLTASAL